VFFGTLSRHVVYYKDLTKEEFYILWVMVIFIILLGVYPRVLLEDFNLYIIKEIIMIKFLSTQQVVENTMQLSQI